jgi:hypothetical protein
VDDDATVFGCRRVRRGSLPLVAVVDREAVDLLVQPRPAPVTTTWPVTR